jgi:O-antigen/teichoic acid export membrane protein
VIRLMEEKDRAGAKSPELKSIYSGLARNGLIVSLALVLGKILEYLIRVGVARFWGPAAFGIISLAHTIFIFSVTISLLGFDTGVSRFVAFYRGRGEDGKASGTVYLAFLVAVPLSIGLSLLLFSISNLLSVRVFHDGRLTPVLKLFSTVISFAVVFNLSVAGLRGLNSMFAWAYNSELVRRVVTFGVIVLLLVLGRTDAVTGIAFAFALGYIVAALSSLYSFLKQSKRWLLFSEAVAFPGRELFAFSWPLVLTWYFYQFREGIFTFLLGFWGTVTEVGVFNAAYSTAALLLTAGTALNILAMPLIADLHSRRDIEKMQRALEVLVRWGFYAVFPLIAATIVYPRPFLGLLFGSEYVGGDLVLRIILLGVCVSFVAGPVGTSIAATGMSKVVLIASILGLLTGSASAAILIPRFGIVGAGWGFSCSILAHNLVAWYAMYTRFGFAIPWLSILKYGLSTALGCTAGVGLSLTVGLKNPLYHLLFAVCFCYMGGIIGLKVLGGLTLEERESLRHVKRHSVLYIKLVKEKVRNVYSS